MNALFEPVERLGQADAAEGGLLQLDDRKLPLSRAAVRTLASTAAAAAADEGPDETGRALWEFVRFYFLDQGALKKDVDYAALLLPPPLATRRLRPESLSFLITKQCNLKCLHCYNDSGAREDGELISSERASVARYLGQWGVPVVTLTGGEPFLSHDSIAVLRILAEFGTSLRVSTNGWHLPEEALEMVRTGALAQMNVSVDGAMAKSHDEYRRVPGSFERVVRSLGRLQEAGIRLLNLNVAVYDRNLGELDAICQLALRYGARAISFKAVTASGRDDPPPETFLTRTGIDGFRRERDVLHARYGRDLMMSAPIVSAAIGEEEGDNVGCGGGSKAMFIGSNGDILPCELIKPYIDVPNVRKTPPLVAWCQSAGFEQFRGFVEEGRDRRNDGWTGCPATNFERNKPKRDLVSIRAFRPDTQGAAT